MPVMYASDPAAAQYADHMWSADFTVQTDDEGEPLILTHNPTDPETITMEAVVVEEDPSSSSSGPFLSEAVFSPSDIEWTLMSSEPNITSDTSPSEDNDERGPFAYHNAPRHISASAFPITPRSASQSLETLPWTDRNSSYAFANAFAGTLETEVGDELLKWMTDDETSRNVSRSSVDSGYIERRSISTASGFPEAKRKRSTRVDEPTASADSVVR
jgi:hypothetical protein